MPDKQLVSNWVFTPDHPGNGKLPTSPTAVVNRQVFYNNSFFDTDPAGVLQSLDNNALDDSAIDPSKVALLPGQTAKFANYTSYSRGLNGLIIDVAGLPAGAGPTAAAHKPRIKRRTVCQ